MTRSENEADPKEKADVPPVLPREQPTSSKGGGALSPEDLDFTDSPYVAEVSDGRYVVSSDTPPNVAESQDLVSASGGGSAPARDGTGNGSESNPLGEEPTASPEAARSLLAQELERTDAQYAIDIVSRFDTRTVRHRTTSDDVVGTFNGLVLWYAQHVALGTPTARTASLLMAKSEFTPPLSPEQIRRAARKHGLDRSSTIGDLLDAIE